MNQQPPDRDEFDDVDDFYRRASAVDSSRPGESVRRAVLAHATRLADERGSPRVSHKSAASRMGWRPAVFGTLAAAALAGLMVAPRFFAPSTPAPTTALKTASGPPRASLSAPAVQEASSAEPPASANATSADASVPGLAAAPSRDLARSQEPAPPPERAQPPPQSRELARSQQPTPPAPSTLAGSAAAQSQSTTATASAASAPSAVAARAAPTGAQGKSTTLVEVTVTGARRRAEDQRLAEVVVVGPSPTELRGAAETGDLAVLRKLLEMRVDIDSRDDLGRTALMLATLRGHSEAVDLLLEKGADPNVADNRGVTPLQAARQGKNAAIAAALERRGGR